MIGKAHDVYKELKMRLQSKGAIPSDRSVNAVSDDLVQDLTWYFHFKMMIIVIKLIYHELSYI